MLTTTRETLELLITAFIKGNSDLHDKSVEFYLTELDKAFKDIDDEIILNAVKITRERKYHETKHINYFKGIVLNSKIELEKKQKVENESLTPIPTKIVWQ